tara:strand:- start:2772 stop:3239 length:468 start_codon:yes stop_codon:yes gene_type:complete
MKIMKKYLLISLLLFVPLWSQDDEDLDLDMDMDAMWDNTMWTEIEEASYEDHEVDKITAVAGVRGAEAEDEALHHLYYRQSMKGPSPVQLNKALGKLMNSLSALKKKDKNHAKIPELTHYIIQIHKKLKNTKKAKNLEKELISIAPDSKWAKFYQ